MKGSTYWVWILPLTLLVAGWGANNFRRNEKSSIQEGETNSALTYGQTMEELGKTQAAFSQKWKAASIADQTIIETEAGRAIAQGVAEQLFPYWVGTGWDFNGTTTEPGKGKIACGYFVTTLLEDAGVILPRVKLAQQASSIIMTSLSGGEKPKWYSQMKAADFAQKMASQPEGLYVLGLDYHTGFLWVTKGKVYFLHSNYLAPQKVTMELVGQSAAIEASSVKVVGKVSTSSYFIRHWLKSEPIGLIK